MRHVIAVTAFVLLALPLFAQTPAPAPAPAPAPQPQPAVQTVPFSGVQFTWPQPPSGTNTLTGFGHTQTQEIGRYDTLNINVNPAAFNADVARQLGGSTNTPLVAELTALNSLAAALKNYTNALSNAVAAHPSSPDAVLDDPDFKKASTALGLEEIAFPGKVKPLDPDLYKVLTAALTSGKGYPAVAQALQQGIDTLNARLQASIANTAAFGMTATLVPLEADARALHLPGYDNNAQLATAAVPTYIPVVDARTQAELQAAQTLAQTTISLRQVPDELKKTLADAKASLDALQQTLKQDLDKNLADVQTAIEASGRTDLGPLLTSVKNARALVQNLNSPSPTLTGDDPTQQLLNLAASLNTTADAITAAFSTLPQTLVTLQTDIEKAVKSGAINLQTSVLTSINTEVAAFKARQTFFIGLRDNLKKLAEQFAPNSMAVISAQRMLDTAQSVNANTNLSTSLDLAKIPGAVNVQDRVQIDAALFRRDATGNLKPVSEATQTFVIERFGIYPDNVRGGLIFVQPRTSIERNISYQPTIALGYYWRYGSVGHPGWNANSPSVGFTMSLLDFSDSSNIEVGIAGGVSLLRDLLWTGYGRNLQAKANYFYVGVNALGLGKLITNRR